MVCVFCRNAYVFWCKWLFQNHVLNKMAVIFLRDQWVKSVLISSWVWYLHWSHSSVVAGIWGCATRWESCRSDRSHRNMGETVIMKQNPCLNPSKLTRVFKPGAISWMTFLSQFKFKRNTILLSPKLKWGVHCKILHMPWQHCCHAMCEIL